MPINYKNVIVRGTPNAVSRFVIKNAAGNTYNIATESFESGTNFINIAVGPTGRAVFPVVLPSLSSDDTYTLTVKPTVTTKVKRQLIEKEDIEILKDYVPKTITFATTHGTAGYSIASGLAATISGKTNQESFISIENLQENGVSFSLSGNVTKAGNPLLYVTRQPIGNFSHGDPRDDDFTNHAKPDYTVAVIGIGAVKLEGTVLGLSAGDYIWGRGVDGALQIADAYSSGATIEFASYTTLPTLEVGQTLHFSEGGHYVYITKAQLSGSGTTTIAATAKGRIAKMGYEDDTITWALDNSVTTVPNIFGDDSVANTDRTATCAAGETVTIDCGDGDTDANAASKTYSRVSGPSKGTVGNNSTAFDNNTFTGSSITYNNTSGSGTDSFVIKCNDGTTDSANQTVTVTLT